MSEPTPEQPHPTPAHAQAWQEYWQHPDAQRAQAEYTAREQQLAPLRAYIEARRAEIDPLVKLHNDEVTRAKLAAQQTANVPMQVLTRQIRKLDEQMASMHTPPPSPPDMLATMLDQPPSGEG